VTAVERTRLERQKQRELEEQWKKEELRLKISPLEIRDMIRATRKKVLDEQRVARIEELARSGKLKKTEAYHRDRGLVRIHESDAENFSIFFKRPVRGYLCEDCFRAARNKLDRLTLEVQRIISRAKEPPVRRAALARAGGPVSGSALLSSPKKEPTAGTATLSGADVLQLRLLMRCGVCQRRQASYFFRRTVLFLCEFCTAADKMYRDNALLLCDEPMPSEHVTLLHSLRLTAEATRRATSQQFSQLRPAERHAVMRPTLFDATNNVDLFRVQTSELWEGAASETTVATDLSNDDHDASSPSQPTLPNTLALRPQASFFLDRTVGNTATRDAARFTGLSLFAGTVLKPAVDLFHAWGTDSDGPTVPAIPSRFLGSSRSTAESSTKDQCPATDDERRSDVPKCAPSSCVESAVEHCAGGRAQEGTEQQALHEESANRRQGGSSTEDPVESPPIASETRDVEAVSAD
jgi:hypothetical protein